VVEEVAKVVDPESALRDSRAAKRLYFEGIYGVEETVPPTYCAPFVCIVVDDVTNVRLGVLQSRG